MITKSEQNKLAAFAAAEAKIAENRARVLAEIRARRAEEDKNLQWLIGSTLVKNARNPACRAGLEAVKGLLKYKSQRVAVDELLNPSPSEFAPLLALSPDADTGRKN
ncbi:MAG: hypothetical protein KF897_07525 [Opitutaceae bacterium]|nr:hypothetical protein [Opitutaceae bacterium]